MSRVVRLWLGCRGSRRRHDLDGCRQLSHVTLRVFGRMEQQAEHGRRQLRASHAAHVKKRCLAGSTKLLKRAIDGVLEVGDESDASARFAIGIRFHGKRSLLSGGKRFTASVGEQSIEAPGRVPDVKSDGSGAAGTRPYLQWLQRRDVLSHFFTTLEQTVCDGLEQCGNPRNRSSKPYLRLTGVGHVSDYRQSQNCIASVRSTAPLGAET
jgi:hypothetical protein